MGGPDVPIGVAGSVGDGSYQWLLDDRSGPGSLGGVFFCEVTERTRDWESFITMASTLDEAVGLIDSSVVWLTRAESEPIVALIPLRSVRLEHLVSRELDGELFALESHASIAEAYVRWLRTSKTDPSHMRDWWAVACWYALFMRQDEQRFRDGLLALVAAATDDHELGCIGAGPLEDLIADDEDTLSWIDAQAARSEAFRRALASVWIWDFPPHVFERVERAAGVPLARPGRP